jgi:uncharacterized protein (TIGR03437 family)
MRTAAYIWALLISFAVRSYGAVTPDQFRADLQYVVSQLTATHPNPFFSTPAFDFYAAAGQLDSDADTLTSEQFYTRLGALVALIHDPHTSLGLTGPTAAALGFELLPIKFRYFADGVFVTAAPPNQPSLAGARLLDVNGKPLADVLALLESQIAHDNDGWLRVQLAAVLANSGVLRGAGIAPAAGPIPFAFQLSSGEQVTIALSSDNSTSVPALSAAGGYTGPLLNHTGENYWSEYWAYAKTVYVRYAACVEMPSRPVSQFIADTLTLIDDNSVETLVIDFRDNGGGSDGVFIPLVTALEQRMKTLRANPRFRLYTLINNGTFSSAMDGAMDLKLNVIPATMTILGPAGSAGAASILVGEPTGGKPAEYGNVTGFTLPASQLSIFCSTRYFSVMAGIPDRDSVYPDVAVNVRSTDYFARHDAILAAALAHASPPPAAPSGRAIVVNSASFRYETGIASGSFASAFGNFPTGDLKVLVNGMSARLLGATSTQITFVVPPEAPVGMATLQVSLGGSAISDGQFEVTAAGPGLFVAAVANSAQPGAVLNQDNALNTAAAPAAQGSVVQIFATGYGRLDASGSVLVSVWIANRPAEVLYSGPAPGVDGLWQINVRIPADTAVTKQVPVFISAEGLVSNGVTIYAIAP